MKNIFKILTFLLISISFSNAELLNPNSNNSCQIIHARGPDARESSMSNPESFFPILQKTIMSISKIVKDDANLQKKTPSHC